MFSSLELLVLILISTVYFAVMLAIDFLVFSEWKRIRDSRLGPSGFVVLFLVPTVIPLVINVLSALAIIRASRITWIGGGGLWDVLLQLPEPTTLSTLLA